MEDQILIETSVRHVHISPEHIEVLFGQGAKLEPRRGLEQPGLFVCKERVDLVGPKGTIQRVSILGPSRDYTQVELSMTDAYNLGIEAPYRESGDLENTPGCTIIGPVGKLVIEHGVIIPWRHIHVNSKDAEKWGISDKDIVSVKVEEDGRALIFNDVLARVHPKVMTFMHIDTDEANAAGIRGRAYGTLV